MDLNHAIERALDGHAILFLGSGFPFGATNVANTKFKRGTELATALSKAAGLPADATLDDAAEAYLEMLGEDALIQLLQREYTVQKVKPFHRTYATIPWNRIYTTNYDNVIEHCYALEKATLVPITLDLDPYTVAKDSTLCVHLNGLIDRLDRESLGTQLKLTETSYLTEAISESPWAVLFREDLRLAQAVFFIGYSLYDLDIKRILFEFPTLKDKCFFVLGSDPDANLLRRVSRFGTHVPLYAEGFAKELEAAKKTYVPAVPTVITGVAIKETVAPVTRKPITDQDFVNLMLFGTRSDGHITESYALPKLYFLERPAVKHAFELIDKGHRLLAVVSNLGNGKSLFLDGLRIRATEKGYRVFDAQERTSNISQELLSLAKLPGKLILTIEEYQGWLDDIRLFRLNSSQQAVIIVSARNSIHDVLVDDLVSKAGVDEIPEIQLDSLSDDDAEWVIDAFNEYGMWGDWHKKSRAQKRRFVINVCRRQMHAILLKLLESPDIGKRLRSAFQDVSKKKTPHELMLSILILTLINQRPTIDMLVDLWGAQAVNLVQLRREGAFREFLDADHAEVRVRSPVAAEYLLKNIADPATVVDVLVHITRKADDASRATERYKRIFRQLITFSSIQSVLPETNNKDAIIRFYESIKNLRQCRNNPLFWFQYAIASLVIEDLFRAGRYFKTAYSLATDTGFDTYQIDNHFARFLLVKAIRECAVKEAMANFRRARNIINRQVTNERRHYPYRVAVAYQEFLDRFAGELAPKDIQEIKKAAAKLLKNIEDLPAGRKGQRSIRECQKAMEYVTEKADDLLVKAPAP